MFGLLSGCVVMPFFMLLFFVFVFFGITTVNMGGGNRVSASGKVVGNKNLSPEVLKHKSMLEKYLKEKGIEEYLPYLLAIMQIESGGVGGDPMQSSESAGLPMNTYTDPEQSIKQGVHHFDTVLKLSKEHNADIWAVMQSYNYGNSYIAYIGQNGGKNTLELAERYSREVVAPSLGNHNGSTYQYVNAVSQKHGKTYLYLNGGNFFYAEKVREHLDFENSVVAGSGKFIFPIVNPQVTSPYGVYREMILQNGQFYSDVHNGIDFVNGDSNTPILAVDNGTVVYAQIGADGGLGIIIKHSDNLYSHYWHMRTMSVSVGDTVSQGDEIGIIGTTGTSTAIHLHFGVSSQQHSDFVDPNNYFGK